MASLPAQHPRLALHLTDRALTPIISSSSSSSQQPQHHHHHPSNNNNKKNPSYPPKRPAFSTSPPPDDDSSTPSSSPSSSSATPPQAEEALSSLSSTALSAYDAAKRLDKGAPLRTMVEYPDGGLVVLHSYMCPMSLALGTPGRNASSASLHTTAGAVHHHHHHEGMPAGSTTTTNTINGGDNASAVGESRQARLGLGMAGQSASGIGRPRTPTTARPLSSAMMDPPTDSDGEGEESPNAPPMLIGTVVAPRAEDLREARRAAGRLERIARVFQTEWVVEGGGGGGGGVA